VLSSYFYGAIVTQVPGGVLAAKFGGKWVIGLGSLVGAVITLLTPLAAYQSLGLLLTTRIVEGFVLGVSFPAMHVMWAKWAPPLEKSKLSSISYAGPFVGTIAALAGSGFFSEYGFKSPPYGQRWPSVFYIFGCLGLIWSAAWLFIVSDSPSKHPTISSEERAYIESKINEAASSKKEDGKVSAVWLAARISTSPAAWAITVSHFCSDWGFFTLLTSLPTFLSDVLEFNIKDDGMLSALPFAVMAVAVICAGYFADFLRRRQILSTTNSRKLMTSVGLLFPGLFLIITSYVSSASLAVSFLVLSVGLSGATYSGFFINHLDIAPRFAGVLMGITNAAGMLAGIIAPYVAGALTTGDSPEVI
jgi:MFS family permease